MIMSCQRRLTIQSFFFLLQSAQSGFLKVLGDKLREFPQSRCNKSQECVDLVKKGTTVYISVTNDTATLQHEMMSILIVCRGKSRTYTAP